MILSRLASIHILTKLFRHPQTFNCILNFYRTGRLHVMEEMCVVDYSEDLQYWKIDEIWLEQCCENKFNTKKDFITDEMRKEKAYEEAGKDVYEDFGDGKLAKYQRVLWDTFEKPHKSALAKYISLLSISLVLLSTVGMCLNTMPSFRHYDSRNQPMDNPNLALIEAVCISWFTIEYLLRLAGAPGKLAFMKQSMNVIDALAIAPYYISLMFFEDPEMINIPGVDILDSNVTSTSTTLAPTNATVTEAEEGGGVFGDVSRIIQVFILIPLLLTYMIQLGVPYCPYHAYLQANPQVCWVAGHCPYHEEQLQGARPTADVCWDGDAHFWKPLLFC